jgi:hypothetical protein
MYTNKNDITRLDKKIECHRKYNSTWMEFICPDKLLFNDIPIDDINSTILKSIESLHITGKYDIRGPLTRIPSNICRFIKLQVYNKK